MGYKRLGLFLYKGSLVYLKKVVAGLDGQNVETDSLGRTEASTAGPRLGNESLEELQVEELVGAGGFAMIH